MTQRLYARWFYFCLWGCLLLACQPVDEGTPTVTLTALAAAPTPTTTPTFTPLPDTPTSQPPAEEMELPDFPTHTPIPPTITPTPTRPQPLPGPVLPSPIIYQTGGQINAVAAAGNLAYVGVGPRLYILDVTDPANPQVVGVSGMLPGVIEDLVVGEGVVYAAAGEAGLWVIDVTDAAAPRPIGDFTPVYHVTNFIRHEQTLFVIDQPFSDEAETGVPLLHVINASNPAQLTVDQTYNLPARSYGMLMVADQLYINGENSLYGLDIADIANLQPSFALPELRGGSMNLSGNELYMIIPGGIVVLDVSQPQAPIEIQRNEELVYRGMESISALATSDEKIFFIRGGGCDVSCGSGSLHIIRKVDLMRSGTGRGIDLNAFWTGDLVLSDDLILVGADTTLQIFSIVSGAPILVGHFETTGQIHEIAIDGVSLYAVSPYNSVISLLDRTYPTQPVWLLRYANESSINDMVAGGGYLYLGTYMGKLQIAQINEISQSIVAVVGPDDRGIEHTYVTVYGDGLVFASMGSEMVIVDISDPSHPFILNNPDWETFSGPDYFPLAWADGKLFTSSGSFTVLDVNNPVEPTEVGRLSETSYVCEVFVQDGLAYLMIYDYCYERFDAPLPPGKMEIVLVTQPENMTVIGSVEVVGLAEAIVVIGNYAYVANGDVLVVDVHDPSQPVFITTIITPGHASDLLTADGLLYIADQAGGLLVIQPLE